MTHRNVLATLSAVMTIVPALGSKDIYLAYLPLAHILELAAEVAFNRQQNGSNLKSVHYIVFFERQGQELCHSFKIGTILVYYNLYSSFAKMYFLGTNGCCWGLNRIWITFDPD
jgi:hypothetical protein